jgi:hypothetical protein
MNCWTWTARDLVGGLVANKKCKLVKVLQRVLPQLILPQL